MKRRPRANDMPPNPRFASWRSRLATSAYRLIGSLPIRTGPTSTSPVFLIGCGRSGTTITAQILAHHPDLCVLNEPRHLWRAVLATTDIWYARQGRPAQLILRAEDADPAVIRRGRRILTSRLFLSGKSVLVEKLPANSFRMPFLDRIFPTCRFVHLVRHGLEVSHSIARTGVPWYQPNGEQIWGMLRRSAERAGWDAGRLAQCDAPLARGLVEWTLSVHAARQFAQTVGGERYLEIWYDDLLSDTRGALSRLAAFLQVPLDEGMRDFAERNLQRRSAPAATLPRPDFLEPITRDLLAEIEQRVLPTGVSVRSTP